MKKLLTDGKTLWTLNLMLAGLCAVIWLCQASLQPGRGRMALFLGVAWLVNASVWGVKLFLRKRKGDGKEKEEL